MRKKHTIFLVFFFFFFCCSSAYTSYFSRSFKFFQSLSENCSRTTPPSDCTHVSDPPAHRHAGPDGRSTTADMALLSNHCGRQQVSRCRNLRPHVPRGRAVGLHQSKSRGVASLQFLIYRSCFLIEVIKIRSEWNFSALRSAAHSEALRSSLSAHWSDRSLRTTRLRVNNSPPPDYTSSWTPSLGWPTKIVTWGPESWQNLSGIIGNWQDVNSYLRKRCSFSKGGSVLHFFFLFRYFYLNLNGYRILGYSFSFKFLNYKFRTPYIPAMSFRDS